jgi:hypothetical protein
MGDVDFATLKAQLKYRMGMDTGPEEVGSSDTNFYGVWVNQAYRQICSSHTLLGTPMVFRIPELETSSSATTTDGTAYVDVPSDCLTVRTVFDETNDRQLKNIPYRTYLAYTDRATAASEGDPTEWARMGSRIYLHPTPGTTGDTLTIHYKKYPDALDGENVTIIGAEWDEPIVTLAAHKGFTWQGALDKAKAAREEFLEMAAGIIRSYEEEVDRDVSFEPSSAYMPR